MLGVEERIQIVLLMAKMQSVTLVRRHLARDGCEVPSERTIRETFTRFKETGSVMDRKRSGRPSNEEDREEVLEHLLEENSNTSIRKLCNETGFSYGSVQHTLKVGLKKFPYKLQIHQGLSEEDCASRVQMCDDLLSLMAEDEEFLKNIIFSDEATFNINGVVNRHNCRIWGSSAPTEVMKRVQGGAKVTVWIGMSFDKIYGPYFFENNVSSANYLDMLQRCFVPALSHRERNTCVFQQDGAPAHYGRVVRDYLDSTFPRRWIGRSGQMTWAARSPDLSPLDFFMWGLLKDRVYHRKPQSLSSLKAIIEDECLNIDQQFVKNAIESFQTRLKICIDNEGKSVEHY